MGSTGTATGTITGAKNTGAARNARPKRKRPPFRLQHSGTLRKAVTLGGMLPECEAPIEVTEGGMPRARPFENELCACTAAPAASTTAKIKARRIAKVYTWRDAQTRERDSPALLDRANRDNVPFGTKYCGS